MGQSDGLRMRFCAVTQEGSTNVSSVRLGRGRSVLARAILASLAVGLGGGSVSAQGKLDARYTASLAGIPLGKGAWVIDITDDQYTAAASGGTSGLLKVFATGQGTGAARGAISNTGILVPQRYAATITTDKKSEEVRITLNAGTVKEYTVEPPTLPSPDRVPVTDAHRRGVSDPMTASLVHVAGSGDPVAAEACARRLSIFDGRMRYDIQLAYKRFDKVKADKGYQGPVVVCAAYFLPLAGYVPDRPAVKYLIEQRDMEVWLAPVFGTRVLVPFRVSIPTPLGVGLLEATQFVTAPQPGKLVPTSARTQ
jgi:Protein of unknown function (DUF3108)